MGIFTNKKVQRLLAWQRVMIQNAPNDKLITTEEQLRGMTRTELTSIIAQFEDCKRIINSTVNPEVFFSRCDLLIARLQRMCDLKPFVSLGGDDPEVLLQDLLKNRQNLYYTFLVRAQKNLIEKAASQKTEKAKQKRIEEFKMAMSPYRQRLNDYNRNYLDMMSI